MAGATRITFGDIKHKILSLSLVPQETAADHLVQMDLILLSLSFRDGVPSLCSYILPPSSVMSSVREGEILS